MASTKKDTLTSNAFMNMWVPLSSSRQTACFLAHAPKVLFLHCHSISFLYLLSLPITVLFSCLPATHNHQWLRGNAGCSKAARMSELSSCLLKGASSRAIHKTLFLEVVCSSKMLDSMITFPFDFLNKSVTNLFTEAVQSEITMCTTATN